MSTQRMTEFELFQALTALYPPREYAVLPQVANGTGSNAKRHCDALALSLWPSRGIHLSGFEIKSYRGDWVREVRNPEKAEEIAQYCNYWWIVAGGPFVTPDELPEPWGLLVWDRESGGLKKAKTAKFREAVAPTIDFLAAAMRKAQEVVTPAAVICEAARKAHAEGFEQGKQNAAFDVRGYAELKARVAAFEKASGVKIDRCQPAEKIGAAVREVLENRVTRNRDQLRSIAQRILVELEGV